MTAPEHGAERDSTRDAVIVGAGLAGSTAAILLARAGWDVALVEKKRFPRRKVCGECLAASNLPLLDALGVGDAFRAAAGAELRRVTLMRGDAETSAPLPRSDVEGAPWGRALGRDRLDALLLERARAEGARVLQPATVRAVGGAPGAWRCEVRTGGGDGDASGTVALRAPVLIDAHGSWESLASERETARPVHRASDLLAFKANFSDAAHAPGTIGVLALDGGYGGTVVADGGLTVVAGCVRRDRLDALRAASPGLRAGDAFGAWLARECRGVREALAGATREGPWLASGPLRPGARAGGDDGVLRVGNAGGEAHPILGEGMSMALQSAALLCAHLLEPDAPDPGAGDAPGARARVLTVQRAYAADWRREFAARLRLAAAFAHVAMRPRASGAMMTLARAWPGLLTHGARRGGKVRLAVDPGTLAGHASPSRLPPRPRRAA